MMWVQTGESHEVSEFGENKGGAGGPKGNKRKYFF